MAYGIILLCRDPGLVGTKGAGETSSASHQVLSSAQALASEGSKLKEDVERFLATVRAA